MDVTKVNTEKDKVDYDQFSAFSTNQEALIAEYKEAKKVIDKEVEAQVTVVEALEKSVEEYTDEEKPLQDVEDGLQEKYDAAVETYDAAKGAVTDLEDDET